MKHIFLKWVLLSTYTIATLSFAAEVPVEDLTQSDSSSTTTLSSPVTQGAGDTPSFGKKPSNKKISATDASLPLEQRVAILERKLDNLLQLDPIGQVHRLQTEVERLRGQIEVQEHNLKQLTEQVKTQYQDLSKRQDNPPEKATTENKTSSSPKTTAATSTQKNDPNEKQAYDTAISLLKKRDYVRANTDLQRYLEDYPDGQYTASAHYWLGEIYSYQGQPDLAIKEYKTVVTKFPNDTKVPDALLKLGFAYDDAGDKEKAVSPLKRVVKDFPNTETAQLASERLKKIEK